MSIEQGTTASHGVRVIKARPLYVKDDESLAVLCTTHAKSHKHGDKRPMECLLIVANSQLILSAPRSLAHAWLQDSPGRLLFVPGTYKYPISFSGTKVGGHEIPGK